MSRVKDLSIPEAMEWVAYRESLASQRFHAIQASPKVKKYWDVVFKTNDDMTLIKAMSSQKKAEKLARLLNETLESVRY